MKKTSLDDGLLVVINIIILQGPLKEPQKTLKNTQQFRVH